MVLIFKCMTYIITMILLVYIILSLMLPQKGVKNSTTKTDVHWTCRVGQTIERIVYIPIINEVRDEAISKVQRYVSPPYFESDLIFF